MLILLLKRDWEFVQMATLHLLSCPYGKIMIINKTHSSFSKPRPAQMMILSLVAMTGLEKCCITSAYLQWLFHSGEPAMACGPLVCLFLEVLHSKCMQLHMHQHHMLHMHQQYCLYVLFVSGFKFNPSLAEHDMPYLTKQCRSRSVGFWRSQLIWICTVCH